MQENHCLNISLAFFLRSKYFHNLKGRTKENSIKKRRVVNEIFIFSVGFFMKFVSVDQIRRKDIHL